MKLARESLARSQALSSVVSALMLGKLVTIASRLRRERKDVRKTDVSGMIVVVAQFTMTDINLRTQTGPMPPTTTLTVESRVNAVVRHWSRYKDNVMLAILKTVMRHVGRGRRLEDSVGLLKKR